MFRTRTDKAPFNRNPFYSYGEARTDEDFLLDELIDGEIKTEGGGGAPNPGGDEDGGGDPPVNHFEALEEAKRTEFLGSIEGANKQDEEGNIVDAEGKVLVKKDELEARIKAFTDTKQNTDDKDGDRGDKTPTIKVNVKQADGSVISKDYKLDKDGNAVDDEGKVVLTKEKIAEARGGNEPSAGYLKGINEQLGFEFKDEKGNPIDFTDDDEGIVNWAKAIVKESSLEAVRQYEQNNPRIAAFKNHLANGGTEADFFGNTANKNWKSVELGDDANGHYNIVYEGFKAMGMSDEKAKKNADRVKDSGNEELKAEAKDMLSELQSNQTKKEKADADAVAAKTEKEKADAIKYWNEAETAIKGGVLPVMKDGKEVFKINIPAGERDAFFEYVGKRADQYGNSQATIDRHNMDRDTRFVLDYIMFKGFNFQKLVDSLVNQQRVNNFKETFSKSNEITLDGNSPEFGNKGGGSTITIEQMLGGG